MLGAKSKQPAQSKTASKSQAGQPASKVTKGAGGQPGALSLLLATHVPADVTLEHSAPVAVDPVADPNRRFNAQAKEIADISTRLGPGAPLEPGVRSQMEKGFGRPFSDVRVHTDAAANRLAWSLSARALTVGNHIAFERGLYRPNEPSGLGLLAHELAHVVQQGTRSVSATPQLAARDSTSATATPQTAALELDANRAALGALIRGTDHGPLLPKHNGWRSPLPGGPTLHVPPGIQKADTPSPLTKLDPTYADTPKAGAAPEPDLSHDILVDGDGDQVPELIVRFSPVKYDPKTRVVVRIKILIRQTGAKPGVTNTSDSFEFDVPSGLDLNYIPRNIKVTDGNSPTIFDFDYSTIRPSSNWGFTLMPPNRIGGPAAGTTSNTVYPSEVWLPGPSGDLTSQFSHDFTLAPGRIDVHNVFRPGDPQKVGPEFWTLDMDVGAYADQFRLTFQKPTPTTDDLEINVVAMQEGTPISYAAPLKTTLHNPLNVKIVSSSGSTLNLSLDGSGITDLEVFDQLVAEADLTSPIQIKKVAEFRSHKITLQREPRPLGSVETRFSVKSGLFERTSMGAAGDFSGASAVQAAEHLASEGKAGSFTQQIAALEQMRIELRRTAANDKLIRPETAAAWDALGKDMASQRSGGALESIGASPGSTPRSPADRQKSAVANANELYKQLLLEPGLPGAIVVLYSTGFSASTVNPYTGEERETGLITVQVEKPTLQVLSDQLSKGQWDQAYTTYNQVADQFDAWIIHQLKQTTRNAEAEKLENALKLTHALSELGSKTNVTPVYAVFHSFDEFQQTGKIQPIPLRLYYYREGTSWKLKDISRPDDTFEDTFKDSGEAIPPHDLFLLLNNSKHFPKGYVQYRILDEAASGTKPGHPGRTGRVECTADWTWADVLGWIAAGLAAAGFIALTFGAGSIVVTGLFVLSGVAGAASGVADLVDAYKHGNMQAQRVALDAAQIIGSLAGAGAGIAAEVRGAQALVNAGKASAAMTTLAKWESIPPLFAPLTATATVADVFQFVVFAKDIPAGLAAIDAQSISDSEKTRAKVVFLAQAAGMAALTVVSVKGALEFKGRLPKIRIDVVDEVPWINLTYIVTPAEYETALNSALSAPAQKSLGTVPVVPVSRAEMIRLTGGKESVNAVVLIEGGKPKVCVVEGSHPSILNEELPHLEQLADKKLGKVASALDEAKLAKWSTLDVGERLKLTRDQLKLEIDAQQRTLTAMQQKIDRDLASGALQAGSPEADQLFRQSDDLWQNLEHLYAKDASLVGLEREFAQTKKVADPTALADVPRLYSKATTAGFDLEANWRTLSREDFIKAYQAKYPNSSLTPEQLGQRWDMGKRLNPSTWHLASAEGRKSIPPPDIRAEYKKPAPDVYQPGSKEVPLSGKEKSDWDALIKKRDKWKAEKAKLESSASPNEDALRVARYELQEASRQIGEMSARQYVQGRWGSDPNVDKLTLIYPKGGGSRAGDFDLVYSYFNKTTNRTEYIVVEAKGGAADLGSRMAVTPEGPKRVEQGTRPYYESVRDNMASGALGADAQDVGTKLQAAKPEDVNYILVKTPFESGEKTVIQAVKTNDFKM